MLKLHSIVLFYNNKKNNKNNNNKKKRIENPEYRGCAKRNNKKRDTSFEELEHI
jgi:hypothetical protein